MIEHYEEVIIHWYTANDIFIKGIKNEHYFFLHNKQKGQRY